MISVWNPLVREFSDTFPVSLPSLYAFSTQTYIVTRTHTRTRTLKHTHEHAHTHAHAHAVLAAALLFCSNLAEFVSYHLLRAVHRRFTAFDSSCSPMHVLMEGSYIVRHPPKSPPPVSSAGRSKAGVVCHAFVSSLPDSPPLNICLVQFFFFSSAVSCDCCL